MTVLAALAATAQESRQLAVLTPEEAAVADSIAALRLRLERKEIHSTFDTNDLTVVDTISSGNDALLVVLYSNNTW